MLPRLLTGIRRRLFVRVLLIGVAQAGLTLTSSLLLASLLTSSFDAMSLPLIALLIFAAVVIIVLRSLELSEGERIGQDYVLEVRQALFRATIDSRHARQRHGIAMARLITDLTSLKNWISLGITRIIVATFSIAGGLFSLWIWAPSFASWALLLVAGLLALGGALSVPLRRHVRMARRHRGRLAARFGELALARETLLQFGAVRRETRRIRRISRHMADGLAARMRYVGLLRALPEMVLPAGVAMFVVVSMQTPGTDSEKLLVALLILGFVVQPMRDILSSFDYAISFAEGRRRILPVLARRSRGERKTSRSAASTTDQKTHILIQDLGDKQLAVSGQTAPHSFTVPQAETSTRREHNGRSGDMIEFTAQGIKAIVSEDPKAVAALFRWLCGIGDDTPPFAVSLFGRDVNTLSRRERRLAFQLVSPVVPLLRRSLRRNLSDMVPQSNREAIRDVSRLCGIADDPEAGRLGRNKLGGDGAVLSASLDARVRLARAGLAEPVLLLIDDAEFLGSGAAQTALEDLTAHTGTGALVNFPRADSVPSGWQKIHLSRGTATIMSQGKVTRIA